MEKDKVHGEEVDWEAQMLSALSVTNIAIIQRSVTQTSVLVVAS